MTGLATGQLSGSGEQGSRAVAPGESTRGVEYKERGGMWLSEMADMWECVGGCYGVASERR